MIRCVKDLVRNIMDSLDKFYNLAEKIINIYSRNLSIEVRTNLILKLGNREELGRIFDWLIENEYLTVKGISKDNAIQICKDIRKNRQN